VTRLLYTEVIDSPSVYHPIGFPNSAIIVEDVKESKLLITKREGSKNMIICKVQIMLGACAASVLGFSALAQDTTSSSTIDGADQTRNVHMRGTQHNAKLNDAAKASDVIGMPIINDQGARLGKWKTSLWMWNPAGSSK